MQEGRGSGISCTGLTDESKLKHLQFAVEQHFSLEKQGTQILEINKIKVKRNVVKKWFVFHINI